VGSQDFVLSFRHRYHFEFSDGESWDGAVIEVSQDDGVSWVDINTLGDPGYGAVIGSQASNPLGGREGYGNQNPSWPAMESISIDMGTALAGKTVKIRFRIGTDEADSESGWEIDDIGFQGITNSPFSTLSSDSAICTVAPIPDADPDRHPDPVVIDGCGCSVVGDSDGAPRSPLLPMVPLASLAAAAMLRRRRRRTA
jgi:MYXO-CTERM domain-containing protein